MAPVISGYIAGMVAWSKVKTPVRFGDQRSVPGDQITDSRIKRSMAPPCSVPQLFKQLRIAVQELHQARGRAAGFD